MKTIAVVCEKGGTGKSMVSYELYLSYIRQGIPASFYAMDGQYQKTNKTQITDGAEVAIVDTPGGLMQNIEQIIENADVIVVPTRPVGGDMEPLQRTVRLVRGLTDAPMVIVVNGMNRFKLAMSFIQWINGQPWAEHVVTVPQSEAIAQAITAQCSVFDIERKFGAASMAISNLCREVSARAGLPHEVIQPKKPRKISGVAEKSR